MTKILHCQGSKLFLFFLLFLTAKSGAQDIPFNGDFTAYLFQNNDVFAIDEALVDSISVAQNITSGNINGAGYNAKDGYIWGYLTSASKSSGCS